MSTKQCHRCGQELPVSSFNPRRRVEPDRLKPYCIDCERAYKAERYQANVSEYKSRILAQNRRYARENRARIYMYLLEHPCVDCSEPDPEVLEFDHVRGTKSAAISQMAAIGTWPRIAEEIAKCDVRCANCHRRKTAKDLGHYVETRALVAQWIERGVSTPSLSVGSNPTGGANT